MKLFFAWCVPGLVLVAVGVLLELPALPQFGVSLLCIGLVFYGKHKGYHVRWRIWWRSLSLIFLVLGLAFLIAPR